MMPRLDGYGVLLELRARQATAAIPFIFTTARAADADIRKGMNIGADDYITKPYARLDLLQSIQTRLEKKALFKSNHQRDIVLLQTALEQEQEQRLLKAKFVAMFSHDFRNPLTAILSSIGLVKNYAERMDESTRLKHLGRAESSVRQLLQMLDDMLFLAQMETNSLNIRKEPLDLGPFIQSIVEEFQEIHGETYTVYFDGDITDSIMMDPRPLRQITANLITNAIKYSPPGSEVRVTLENHEDYCRLTVQDQGIGIPETDQPRLFSAFQRGSNVSEVLGTGLGLAIVKQAVQMLGGAVQLESQVGVGTTVTVDLPIESQKE